MTKRFQRLVLAVAALAALALGGAVFAQAQSSPLSAHERTGAPDRDNVQSGDQTTPDGSGATKARSGRHHALRERSRTGGLDGDTVQSGDQSTPDQTGAASERPGVENPEQGGAGSESAPGSDGPGGHADEPGNANADHQFQGNE